jgi:hypothetical protein
MRLPVSEPEDKERIVRSKLPDWDFGPREKGLFDSAKKELPTWRMANQARRHLAGVTAELTNGIPAPKESTLVAKIDATLARQLASVRLAAIVVRTTSAVMSQIACGHEREALAGGRTILEALIRCRQVADDESGEAARTLLQGRKPGSLKAAAQRYGEDKDVELLNRFSHADPLSLIVVETRREGGFEADLELLPKRGNVNPVFQLYSAGYSATMFSAGLAEIFEVTVEIPAFLSGQLRHFKENPLPKGV